MELVNYTIRQGNTLFGIAQFFDTTVEDILQYNNLTDRDTLYVGQTITIPAGSKPVQNYVVRPYDSLWSIAQRFNTSVNDILRDNNIANPNIIYPGQIIKVR